MKKLILISMCLCTFFTALQATCKTEQQRLTKEQFRAKQQTYITEKAQLTEEEAARFFPLYFELQDRKKQVNDEAWAYAHKIRGKDAKEKEYEEALEAMYDARIASDRLERTYFEKFKKILSFKKIYDVQRAEMRFQRELVRGMWHYKHGEKTTKKQP